MKLILALLFFLATSVHAQLNVGPNSAEDNAHNRRFADMELFREFHKTGHTFDVSRPDVEYLLVGKFCSSLPFASANAFRWVAFVPSNPYQHLAFSQGVLNVVRLRSKKQVVGADTSLVITIWAVVADLQSIWDSPKGDEPRKSVGQPTLSLCFRASRSESSIATITNFSGPNPAPGCLVNVAPEKIDDVGREDYSWFRDDVVAHIVLSRGRSLLGSGSCVLHS